MLTLLASSDAAVSRVAYLSLSSPAVYSLLIFIRSLKLLLGSAVAALSPPNLVLSPGTNDDLIRAGELRSQCLEKSTLEARRVLL